MRRDKVQASNLYDPEGDLHMKSEVHFLVGTDVLNSVKDYMDDSVMLLAPEQNQASSWENHKVDDLGRNSAAITPLSTKD